MATWEGVQAAREAAKEQEKEDKKEFEKKKKAFLKKYPFSADPQQQKKNYEYMVEFLLDLEMRMDKSDQRVGSTRHRHIRK